MTDELKSALSPDEWKARHTEWKSPRNRDENGFREGASYIIGGSLYVAYDDGLAVQAISSDELPALIALANAALPGDSPYKITRDMVQRLERAAPYFGQEFGFEIDDLLHALAALLPPETP